MARLKFKKKCGICREEWVLINDREYPICVNCHMKQIFSEEITEKKYDFLNIDKKIYLKSRFLRNIRHSYLRYKSLTDKQVEAFKKAVEDIKKEKD
ncbi:MAG: hypothetical protein ABH824_04780 [Nanoarchaeota archaeon]|nr:hypothetical protein [Nanoarchaeota archaeon]MBU1632849.1 hypothetical protein [Nanoarchaeota archaeon]MBU1875526.1 hypothetical protein [Nanoarchaeota archaeon]